MADESATRMEDRPPPGICDRESFQLYRNGRGDLIRTAFNVESSPPRALRVASLTPVPRFLRWPREYTLAAGRIPRQHRAGRTPRAFPRGIRPARTLLNER